MAKERESGGDQVLSDRLAQALPRLRPEQLAQVSPRFKRVAYAPGEVVIRQDDPPRCFYIVLSGRAEVSHRTPDGRNRVLDVCTPGTTFGEIGLLKNRPRTATVSAAADGELEVLVLEREDFLALVKDSRATETQVTQDLIRHMINLAHHQT